MSFVVKPHRRSPVRSVELSARPGGGLPFEGSPPAGLGLPAISGWTTSDFYQTADGEGITGHADGFWAACLFTVSSVGSLAHLANTGLIASRGWSIRMATSGVIIFRAWNGTPTAVDAPASGALSAGTAIHLAIGFFSGAGELAELYLDGARVGTGTACVGYTPPDGADPMRVGKHSGGAPWTGSILGVAGGDGDYPSDAEALAYFAAVKSAEKLVAMAGVTTDKIWNVSTGGIGAPAEWVEENATGENLDKQGTALVQGTNPKQWAF